MKRPGEPFPIVELLLASGATCPGSFGLYDENSTQRLLEWLVRPKQLISAKRLLEPFRTASTAAFLIDAIIPV
jgi:hypothetical protein